MPIHWLIIHLFYNAAILASKVSGDGQFFVGKLGINYTLSDVPAIRPLCLGEYIKYVKDDLSCVKIKLTPFDLPMSAHIHSDWDKLKPYSRLIGQQLANHYTLLHRILVTTDGYGTVFWFVIKYPNLPWEILELDNPHIEANRDAFYLFYNSQTSINCVSELMYVVLGKVDLLTLDWSSCKTAPSPSKPTSLTANIQISKDDLPSKNCKILLRDTKWSMERNFLITDYTVEMKTNTVRDKVVISYLLAGPNVSVIKCKWRIDAIGGVAQEGEEGLMTIDSTQPHCRLSVCSHEKSKIQKLLTTGYLVVQKYEINTVKPEPYWEVLSAPVWLLRNRVLPFRGKTSRHVLELEFSKKPNVWYEIALLHKPSVPQVHQIWNAELNSNLQQLVLRNLTPDNYEKFLRTGFIFAGKRTQGIPPQGTWCEVQVARGQLQHNVQGDVLIPLNQIPAEAYTFSTVELVYLTPLNEEADLNATEYRWKGCHHNQKIVVEGILQLEMTIGATVVVRTLTNNGNKVDKDKWKRLVLPTTVVYLGVTGSQLSITRYDHAIEYKCSKKFGMALCDYNVTEESIGKDMFEGVIQQIKTYIFIKTVQDEDILQKLDSGQYLVVIAKNKYKDGVFVGKGRPYAIIPNEKTKKYITRKIPGGIVLNLGNPVRLDQFNRHPVRLDKSNQTQCSFLTEMTRTSNSLPSHEAAPSAEGISSC